MSNEKEIREFIRNKFNIQFPESFTFDEFSGGTLSTRPDLATFLPNAIIFTEIKSNKDSLSRYHNQIINYRHHSNNVYAILDECHHKKWVQMDKNSGYATYCNTYFYKDGKLYYPNRDEDILEREVKEISYYHNKKTPISILDYLWKSEIHNFLYFIKGKSKIIDEVSVVKRLFTYYEIIDLCHKIIYDRVKESAEKGHKKIQYTSCKQSRYDIEHKEHKQILFNEIDDDSVRKKTVKKKPAPLPMFMQKANEKRNRST